MNSYTGKDYMNKIKKIDILDIYLFRLQKKYQYSYLTGKTFIFSSLNSIVFDQYNCNPVYLNVILTSVSLTFLLYKRKPFKFKI